MKELKIGKTKVGGAQRVFIVAEMSANHRQKFDLAVKTLQAMKEAGANAVKLQTYTPDTMTLNCDNEYFTIRQGTIWDGKNFNQLYEGGYMPWEWQPKLQKIAHHLGLEFFSTPFDETAVDFLDKMGVPAFKIASFEIVDIPLIEYAAAKGKPMILSTGIATLADIEEAVAACRRKGNNKIIILRCTSSYPTPFDTVNLKTIPHLEETFDAIVGLSDHTLGLTVPIAAVAIGAKLVEKHFILDRKLGGPDASFSLEPQEFKDMVRGVRETEVTLGEITYELDEKGKKNRELAPSLFVVRDVKKGQKLTEKNVRSIRPGFGLPPKYLPEIIGKKARKNLKKGTPLNWQQIA